MENALYYRYQEHLHKRDTDRRYYTYTWSYPENYSDTELAGKAFYVGKGSGYRYQHHLHEANRGIQSAKCNAIRSIWAEGHEPVMNKVAENLTHDEALKLEEELIHQYRGKALTNYMPQPRDMPDPSLIPVSVCLDKEFRQEIEESIRFRMQQEDIELSTHACHAYLQEICLQAIRDHCS